MELRFVDDRVQGYIARTLRAMAAVKEDSSTAGGSTDIKDEVIKFFSEYPNATGEQCAEELSKKGYKSNATLNSIYRASRCNGELTRTKKGLDTKTSRYCISQTYKEAKDEEDADLSLEQTKDLHEKTRSLFDTGARVSVKRVSEITNYPLAAVREMFATIKDKVLYWGEDDPDKSLYCLQKPTQERTQLKVAKEGYARIPVEMFSGFLGSKEQRKRRINRMIEYAIYDRYQDNDDEQKTLDFLNMHSSDFDGSVEQGKDIAETITTRSFFYVSMDLLFEFRDKDKSFDQCVLFLMFLALNSIKGTRKFWKTTNALMLSRMDGYDSPVPFECLSDEVRAVGTRRKIEKYKSLLAQYYGTCFYGYRQRGFYFSNELKEQKLMEEALKENAKKKRESKKGKQKLMFDKYVEKQKQDNAKPKDEPKGTPDVPLTA